MEVLCEIGFGREVPLREIGFGREAPPHDKHLGGEAPPPDMDDMTFGGEAPQPLRLAHLLPSRIAPKSQSFLVASSIGYFFFAG
jgi:hypothetical protein